MEPKSGVVFAAVAQINPVRQVKALNRRTGYFVQRRAVQVIIPQDMCSKALAVPQDFTLFPHHQHGKRKAVESLPVRCVKPLGNLPEQPERIPADKPEADNCHNEHDRERPRERPHPFVAGKKRSGCQSSANQQQNDQTSFHLPHFFRIH